MSDAATQLSPLEMSDEDFLNMGSGPTGATAADETPAVEADEAADTGTTVETPAAADAGDEGDDDSGDAPVTPTSGENAAGKAGADGAPASAEAPTNKAEPKAVEAKKPDESKPADKAVVPPAEATPVNYEAEYKRLLAPFKANGKDVQVGSVDDAINLMQMGANYNKKMAGLKPNLKLMKMLENNGLLSEEKLSFLIDLDKKNPDAISKLVKDSGIDPMAIDTEKASAYKQSAYAVDEREIDLDTVLDELSNTPTYNRVLDVVSNKWDVASKRVVADRPQVLKLINDHMASGVYDLITAEIERERMFGRLTSVPDIEAYRQVGDAIQARNGFDHLFKKEQTATNTPAAPVIVEPKPKVENTALNDKRRAAGSPRPAAATTVPADFNPLALSDADFEKLAAPQFR